MVVIGIKNMEIIIFLVLFSIISVICFSLFMNRRMRAAGLPLWKPIIKKIFGAKRSEHIAIQIQERYSFLLAEHSLSQMPILRDHEVNTLLPGLALYQVLLKEYQDEHLQALAVVDECFRAWFIFRFYLFLAPMRIIHPPFWLFRMAFGTRLNAFPAVGWECSQVITSSRSIKFSITGCYYLKMLKQYGSPELTTSFCKTDIYLAEMLPPAIVFTRKHTLAAGDKYCDFQYCDYSVQSR